MRKISSSIALLLAVVVSGCAAPYPDISQVPATGPLPIDGLWLDTRLNQKFQIGGGRMWATADFPDATTVVKKGHVIGVNLRRVGPRKYEAWNNVWQGPYYFTVQENGNMEVVIQTKVFGDAQAVFVPVEIDNRPAWKTEAALRAPDTSTWPPARGTRPATAVAKLEENPASAPPRRAAPPPAALPEAIPVPAGFSFGTYHALLIGNDAYSALPKLESARADVDAIAPLLRDRYGFRTRVLKNASRDQVLLALEQYRRELTPDDNLLVYYAGHGWLDEQADEGYWLPVDADHDSSINWIPNATLTASFKALRAKHVLVVADSCYSGKLTRGLRMQGPKGNDYLRKMAEKRSRIVLAAGGLEPVLDGGGGNHSVFASAFMKALRENEGVLDTNALFSQIRRDVMLAADQTPELADMRKADHQGGDFLFVPKD